MTEKLNNHNSGGNNMKIKMIGTGAIGVKQNSASTLIDDFIRLAPHLKVLQLFQSSF